MKNNDQKESSCQFDDFKGTQISYSILSIFLGESARAEKSETKKKNIPTLKIVLESLIDAEVGRK